MKAKSILLAVLTTCLVAFLVGCEENTNDASRSFEVANLTVDLDLSEYTPEVSSIDVNLSGYPAKLSKTVDVSSGETSTTFEELRNGTYIITATTDGGISITNKVKVGDKDKTTTMKFLDLADLTVTADLSRYDTEVSAIDVKVEGNGESMTNTIDIAGGESSTSFADLAPGTFNITATASDGKTVTAQAEMKGEDNEVTVSFVTEFNFLTNADFNNGFSGDWRGYGPSEFVQDPVPEDGEDMCIRLYRPDNGWSGYQWNPSESVPAEGKVFYETEYYVDPEIENFSGGRFAKLVQVQFDDGDSPNITVPYTYEYGVWHTFKLTLDFDADEAFYTIDGDKYELGWDISSKSGIDRFFKNCNPDINSEGLLYFDNGKVYTPKLN